MTSINSSDRLLTLRPRPRRLALVRQPNVGKSALFGGLTGHYAVVSNCPGTTVTLTQGRALVGGEVCDLVDTPGVNDFEACSRGRSARRPVRRRQTTDDLARADRLAALGVTPGACVRLLQRFPGFVFECDRTELAVERAVARTILVEVQ